MNASRGSAAALAVPAVRASTSGESSALPAVWSSFWRSRLLVLAAGWLGAMVLGASSFSRGAFDPGGISQSLGKLGNVLAAPAVRWDAIWYLQIADQGYSATKDTAFFPLYPLLIRAGSMLTGSAVLAGVMISVASLFIGLAIVHRLAELELGPGPARATVNLLAFTPMAVFFSAVYTESLFLALSAGTFYAARRERWALAGALGGLAAMTRVTGVLLVIPVVLLFLYGPRERIARSPAGPRWRPRHGLDPQLLWVALIPAGAAAYVAYVALQGFDPLATMHVQQQFWSHYFAGPFEGIRAGFLAAWHELRLGASGVAATPYQSQALLQCGVLVVAAVALVGTFRRLPVAYGAYASAALLVPICSPTLGDPLRALDRYSAVLFPLYMAAGAWAVDRGVTRKLVLLSSSALVFFTVQFATWRFVA
jgi:hypothetical protein